MLADSGARRFISLGKYPSISDELCPITAARPAATTLHEVRAGFDCRRRVSNVVRVNHICTSWEVSHWVGAVFRAKSNPAQERQTPRLMVSETPVGYFREFYSCIPPGPPWCIHFSLGEHTEFYDLR